MLKHRFAPLLVVCLLSPSCSSPKPAALSGKRSPVPDDINERLLDPNLDPEAWLKRFEVDSREIYAGRKAIVEALEIAPGTRLADVGSGTGLFLKLFSEAVTGAGRVYALDISPGLVAHLEKRVDREGLENVEVSMSKANSTGLPSGSIDLAFVCDTYHHFEYHEEMLRSLHDSLRRGGQLVVIDFERIPGTSREWVLEHVRAGKDRFRREIEAAGFRFQEEVKIPEFSENYFLRFERP